MRDALALIACLAASVSAVCAADAAIREAITGWYRPATLDLLEGSPINCLLVTLGEGQTQPQALAKEYARMARERGMAVLSIVRPGADPAGIACAPTRWPWPR